MSNSFALRLLVSSKINSLFFLFVCLFLFFFLLVFFSPAIFIKIILLL